MWGIIGALDKEVALIVENMQGRSEKAVCGCTYTTGTYLGRPLTVVCSGIGKVNAAVCAGILVREFGAGAVVNVGIAGAVGEGLRVLDVVVSDHVLFHDQEPELFERYYPFKREFKADEGLVKLCRQVLEDFPCRDFSYQVGRIATGDEFVNDAGRKAEIVARFHPLCVEMEGAAIGQVAAMNGIPFLVVRTMSDNADDNADNSYDDFIDRAASHSAALVLKMLAQSEL